ncbi:restriction endonuclease subunit S [Shewanella baltica]|nr:restriction endonuclease subunit S [Shewanella baltica]AEH12694.1 restriction modification system DNA specificity domain protein [Shewanella baltica OS117]
MSQLSYMEKLLDGVEVEWKALKDVLVRTKGTKITAGQMKTIHKDGAPLKIFAGGKTVAFVDFEDIPEKDVNREPSIIVKSRGFIEFEYYEKPFSHKNEMWSYHSDDDAIHIKFVYHFLKLNEPHFQGIGSRMQMPQIATPDTDKFLVPIPCPDNPEKSLAIQAEIVRILDAFTAMTTELTTELSLRKKQYNYYRDQLLSFEECDVEWKTLEEVAHFANGKGHEKDISEDGKFIVVNSKFISTDGLVAKYSHSQICPLFKDDILLVMSDLPNGKALSKTFIVDEDERYTLNQRIGGITVKDKSEMLPKFLHYYLNRTPQLLKHDNGVDQTNLRKGQILEVKVPILPLQKQEHIVSILDKFDKLTKSLSEGLPREIELRQKQYEYYRDLLLSFPKSDEAA